MQFVPLPAPREMPPASHLALTNVPTELQLFGTPRIYGKRRTPIRLPNLCWALASILAASDDGSVTRDALLVLLWPDSTIPRARAALSQALYLLRGHFGQDAIVSDRTVIALDRSLVGSDVDRFRHCVERREWRSALAEYRGPFLSGFTFRDVPEFEAWVRERREEYERAHRECLWALVDHSQRRGHRADAIAFLDQLTAADPNDTDAATALARARARSWRHAHIVNPPARRGWALTPWFMGAAAGIVVGLIAGANLPIRRDARPSQFVASATTGQHELVAAEFDPILETHRVTRSRRSAMQPPPMLAAMTSSGHVDPASTPTSGGGVGYDVNDDCAERRIEALCESNAFTFYRWKPRTPEPELDQ